jgi:hypothetical protein
MMQLNPKQRADINRLGIPDDHETSMPEGFAT